MRKNNPDVDIDILRFQLGGGTRYFNMGFLGTAVSTATVTSNYLWVEPFFVPGTFKAGQIAINVTVAGSGNARLGIYEDNGKIYPGKLLIDAGEVNVATTGVKTIGINKVLRGGKLYWLAMVSSSNITCRQNLLATNFCGYFGLGSSLGTTWGIYYYKPFTYDTLPDPFPSGGTLDTQTAGSIFLRKDNY